MVSRYIEYAYIKEQKVASAHILHKQFGIVSYILEKNEIGFIQDIKKKIFLI